VFFWGFVALLHEDNTSQKKLGSPG
jgi:hypothetical protein